jgi:hypothetical protein
VAVFLVGMVGLDMGDYVACGIYRHLRSIIKFSRFAGFYTYPRIEINRAIMSFVAGEFTFFMR